MALGESLIVQPSLRHEFFNLIEERTEETGKMKAFPVAQLDARKLWTIEFNFDGI